MQARRKVFAIDAANSGEGGGVRKGVSFTIITCADPVPGKNTLQTSGCTFWCYFEMQVRSLLALIIMASFMHSFRCK